MIVKLATRMLRTVDRKALWKFAWNFGYKGMRSMQKFKRRLKDGVVFPPFIYISVVNSCNLRCQGCWVDVEAEHTEIPLDEMNRLINEAKQHGNSFFGVLGGEPFMHTQLLDIFAAHPDCYFQVFTNGQFITDEKAKKLREIGNVTPLISIEGNEVASDQRRGRLNVLNHTLKGLDNCLNNKVLTGVATSVAKNNIDDLLTEKWLDHLIERGVHYVWYYTYRVIGPSPSEELALDPDQVRRVREFIVEMRAKKPIVMIDAYWDDQGKALCPAAVGFTHHVSPWGDIEPCPIIQFAKEKITDERGIFKTITESKYLEGFRDLARETTRGCIVLERPDLLKQYVEAQHADDTTARKSALAELEELESRRSQHDPDVSVPEKHWLYRFAKKRYYHDFGAYDRYMPKRNGDDADNDHKNGDGAHSPQGRTPAVVRDDEKQAVGSSR